MSKEMPQKSASKRVTTRAPKKKVPDTSKVPASGELPDTSIKYPSLVLPDAPVYVGAPPPETPRPDAEGLVDEYDDPANSPVLPPPVGKDRILIAIPMLSVSYQFFESFLKFWTALVTRQDVPYEVCYQFAYRKPVHMAEEFLVHVAQYNKCTHILFMDDDIFDVTPEDLDKLYNAKKDVIAGVMHASKFPHATCTFRRYNPDRKVIDMPVEKTIYRLYEIPCICKKCGTGQSHWDGKWCLHCGAEQDNMVQEVDLIPFCFTLMNLSIFDKLKRPWFHCTNKFPTDSWFADRILEAGLREHVHMGIRLNHAGVNDATKPFYVQMGMTKARSTNAMVTLTQEDMSRHEDMLSKRMYEVEQRLKERPEIVFDGHVVENKAGKHSTLVTHGL